jgi:hypothetical protein
VRVPVRPGPTTKWMRVMELVVEYSMAPHPGRRVMTGFRSSRRLAELLCGADIVEIHWGQFLPMCDLVRRRAPGTPVMALDYDVMAESMARRAEASGSRFDRMLSRRGHRAAKRNEPRLLNGCRLVAAFSQRDVDSLRELGVTVPTTVMRPMTPLPEVPSGPSHREVGVGGAEMVAEMVRHYEGLVESRDDTELLDQLWRYHLADALNSGGAL